MSKLQRAVDRDPKLDIYRTVVKAAKNAKFNEALIEVRNLHDKRIAAKIHKLYTPPEIMRTGLQDQSYRSRCVALLMTVIDSRNTVAETLDASAAYIKATYKQLIVDSGAKTIADKDVIMRNLLSDAHRIIDRLDSVEEQIELVVDDIDKTAWSLKMSISALEISMSREKF